MILLYLIPCHLCLGMTVKKSRFKTIIFYIISISEYFYGFFPWFEAQYCIAESFSDGCLFLQLYCKEELLISSYNQNHDKKNYSFPEKKITKTFLIQFFTCRLCIERKEKLQIFGADSIQEKYRCTKKSISKIDGEMVTKAMG